MNDRFVDHAEYMQLLLSMPVVEEEPGYDWEWEQMSHTYCLCADCWFPNR